MRDGSLLTGACRDCLVWHCAQVSWVQPRVLTLEQAAGMKARLDDWILKVGTTSMILQEDQIAAIA